MQTKTLKTIQTVVKISKIFTTIIKIFSIVGFVASLVAIALFRFGDGVLLTLGEASIRGIVGVKDGVEPMAYIVSMAITAVICAGEFTVALFAERYFRNELAAGMPFTLDGARELFRLGIIAIVIPTVTLIISEILYAIFSRLVGGIDRIDMNSIGSAGTGVTLLIFSLLCKHGAEISQGTDEVVTDTNKEE